QLLLGYEPNPQIDSVYPIRKQVYAWVQNWPIALRQRALTFVLTHETAATNYNALVLQLVGPAPEFRALDQTIPGGQAEQNLFASRNELSELLRAVWAEGHSHKFWDMMRPQWESNQLCAGHVRAIEHKVTDY